MTLDKDIDKLHLYPLACKDGRGRLRVGAAVGVEQEGVGRPLACGGEARELPGGAAVQYHWASFFPDGRRILITGEEKGKPPRSYIQDVPD